MKLTFAEHLREFRAEKKMSLRELAELLGVSHTLIGLIETNKRKASNKFIRKFAKYSGKDPKLLEFIANPMPLSYKQSIYESEGAPNFLKENWAQETLDGKDHIDELCLSLFREIEFRNMPEDLIYYRRLISSLENMTDRPVVECWGKFYNAFLMEKEVGPELSLRAFQDLYARLVNEPSLQDTLYLRLQTCFKMGQMNQKLEAFEEAIQHFLQARKISEQLKDSESLAMSYYLTGNAYQSNGDRETAIQSFLEGLSIDGPHQHIRAKLLLSLGILYRELGRFPEAVDRMKDAVKLWKLKAVNDSISLAQTHQEMSATYYQEGINYEAALDYVHRSLIIFTRLEQESSSSIAKMGVVKSKLLKSAIFVNSNQLERATHNLIAIIQDYHQLTSIDLSEANNIMREAHELLGVVYEKGKHWVKAEESYRRIAHYPSTSESGSLHGRLRVFINLHNLYNKKSNTADAISMLMQADALVGDFDHSNFDLLASVIELRLLQGNVAFNQGSTQEGVKYHLDACDLSRNCDTTHLLRKSLESIRDQIRTLHTNGNEIFALALYNTITSWVKQNGLENLSVDIQGCKDLFDQI